ncbi:MAG: hypothetical protein ACXV5H_12485 [Halobacteriota archaeon]
MAKGAQFGVVDEILSEMRKTAPFCIQRSHNFGSNCPVCYIGERWLTTAQGEEIFRLQSLLGGHMTRIIMLKEYFWEG